MKGTYKSGNREQRSNISVSFVTKVKIQTVMKAADVMVKTAMNAWTSIPIHRLEAVSESQLCISRVIV